MGKIILLAIIEKGDKMEKITHPIYKDYPEQPYISKERDLKHWEESPEDFPYGRVEKKQMIRLEEGILPGDIIMLWRINFGNFTNETIIPQYFEYKYGVDSQESIERLIDLGYIERCSGEESLGLLNIVKLKKILKNNNLKLQGDKAELLERIRDNIPIKDLEEETSLRKYKSTSLGKEVLEKYYAIVIKHGPKK